MPNYKPKTSMPVVVKEYLRDLLVQNKIEEVNILFSGSGDDGQVNDVYYTPNSVSSVKEDLIFVPEEVFKALDENTNGSLKNHLFGYDEEVVPWLTAVSLENVILGLIDYWLIDMPIDWVNGDGGSGSVLLTFNQGKLDITIKAHEWVLEEGPTYSCKL